MENESIEKKNINIFSILNLIQLLLPTFFWVIIYDTFKAWAALDFEEIYLVPKFYYYDGLGYAYLRIIVILFLVVFFSLPIIFKFTGKGYDFNILEKIFYAFINAYSLMYTSIISIITFNINLNINLSLKSAIIALSLILIILTCLIYYIVFEIIVGDKKILKKIKKNNKKNTEENEKFNKSSPNLKWIVFVLYIIIVLSPFIILAIGTIEYPSNKKNYEIIQNNTEKYNVIIGHYKDKAVLMKGEIINRRENDKFEVILKIKKGDYMLKNVEEEVINFKRFDKIVIE